MRRGRARTHAVARAITRLLVVCRDIYFLKRCAPSKNDEFITVDKRLSRGVTLLLCDRADDRFDAFLIVNDHPEGGSSHFPVGPAPPRKKNGRYCADREEGLGDGRRGEAAQEGESTHLCELSPKELPQDQEDSSR